MQWCIACLGTVCAMVVAVTIFCGHFETWLWVSACGHHCDSWIVCTLDVAYIFMYFSELPLQPWGLITPLSMGAYMFFFLICMIGYACRCGSAGLSATF